MRRHGHFADEDEFDDEYNSDDRFKYDDNPKFIEIRDGKKRQL